VLFRELDRVKALNSGDYSNDNFIAAAHLPGDPKAGQRIKTWWIRRNSLRPSGWMRTRTTWTAFARGVTRASTLRTLPWSSGLDYCAAQCRRRPPGP